MGRRLFRFSSNHRWNAVYLDSSWHLLDVTWASGYVTFNSDEFIKHYNDRYFLTPPGEFIRDHYPEELQWTLLPEPPNLGEYRSTPYRMNSFVTKRIKSYKPESGTIEASVGDTLYFDLVTDYGEKPFVIVDTPYIDSAVIAEAGLVSRYHKTVSGDTITYRYIVTSPTAQWLTVVFDEEMIMRYRLNIKRKEPGLN
jgi:hypothetical protein